MKITSICLISCKAGDTSGIAMLEHALRDAKVELPTHS